jgi:hypothetical protein
MKGLGFRGYRYEVVALATVVVAAWAAQALVPDATLPAKGCDRRVAAARPWYRYPFSVAASWNLRVLAGDAPGFASRQSVSDLTVHVRAGSLDGIR